MDWKKSGYLVQHKDGRIGRTFHGKLPIGGKIQVYFADKMSVEKDGFSFPISYSEKAILVQPKNLKQIGFID